MTIRKKAILILVVTLIALVVVLVGVLSRVIEHGFAQVELDDARKNMARVQQVFHQNVDGICSKAADWAYWDDAYRFVADKNEEFVKSNLTAAPFVSMNLNLILFLNPEGQPVMAKAYDVERGQEVSPPQVLIDRHFSDQNRNIQMKSPEDKKSGIVFTEADQPMLFCALPILTSEKKGPIRGTIVFASYLGAKHHLEMAQATKLDLTFRESSDSTLPADFAYARDRLPYEHAVGIEGRNDDLLQGYTRISDTEDKGFLIVRADLTREILQQAKITKHYLMLALIVSGLVFTVVLVMLVERLVLARMSRISRQVSDITQSFDFTKRVDVQGNDELARLSKAINGLLAAVEQVRFLEQEQQRKPE